MMSRSAEVAYRIPDSRVATCEGDLHPRRVQFPVVGITRELTVGSAPSLFE